MQRFIQKTTLERAKTNKTMKTFTLTLAALLFTLGSHATVITVDNNPNSPADYSDLQTAVDSSNSGDTLYVHGSNTDYGNVTIDRQLTIIGTGYNPDNQWGLKSEVSNVYLKVGSDSTRIIGLKFRVIRNNNPNNSGIKKIYIGRCYISGINGNSIDMSNSNDSWLIENNVIMDRVYVGGATNIIITNNLFRGAAKIVNADDPSVLVTNNTFHNAASSVVNRYCEYMNFRNNILINSDANSSTGSQNPDCDNCTFENNITTENQAFVFGNRTGSNNMVNTNPDLEDTSNGPNNLFNNDYRPKSSSPAINAGTDGKDIGITGGTSPTTVSSTNMPAIPQVIEMKINNTSTPLNDSLEIQIKARKQE